MEIMAESNQFNKQLNEAENWFSSFQNRLIETLENLEPKVLFEKTAWNRKNGGGGTMAMMKQGEVVEKGGCHFSNVYGKMPAALASQHGENENGWFRASGVSVIIHTLNPHAPAAHMNLRYIIMGASESEAKKLWFGGGADLTPMLEKKRKPDCEDNLAFHKRLESACAGFKQIDYQAIKKYCAEYFYLPHRKTERGIGGVFFDNLNSGDWRSDFEFVKSIGEAFLDIYPKLLEKNMKIKWTDEEKKEQAIMRGLYAEFNLLYDRGTEFGLKSGGNVESILSSLPPLVIWE